MTRSELEQRTSRHLARSGVLANLTGAVVVYVFLSYLLVTPVDLVDGGRLQRVNTVVFVVYMTVMLVVGGLVGRWQTRGLWEWLRRDGPADNEVRRLVLALPLRLSLGDSVAWLGAVLVFGALNASFTPVFGFQVAATIALGGVTTVPLSYLLTERVLRPVVTLAHVGAPDPPPILLGVTRRMVLAWAVASGVPLLGIGMGMFELANEEPLSPPAVLFLVTVGLVVGLAATVTAARAVADPVQSVASALRDVAAGAGPAAGPVRAPGRHRRGTAGPGARRRPRRRATRGGGPVRRRHRLDHPGRQPRPGGGCSAAQPLLRRRRGRRGRQGRLGQQVRGRRGAVRLRRARRPRGRRRLRAARRACARPGAGAARVDAAIGDQRGVGGGAALSARRAGRPRRPGSRRP